MSSSVHTVCLSASRFSPTVCTYSPRINPATNCISCQKYPYPAVAWTTSSFPQTRTAKTILVQLHHKIDTFESINKHLVLVIQDHLLEYIKKEFSFDHVDIQPLIGDSMHFHSYRLKKEGKDYKLVLDSRCSTDSEGISKLLGLNAEANVGFEEIAKILETKISDSTVFPIT